MNRFERSWSLFKTSLMVIIRNKELLIFPIFISAATAVILLFFFAPALLWPTGYSFFTAEHWKALGQTYFVNAGTSHGQHFFFSPIAAAYLAFLYLISMFTATFFNVAFYNEILAALSGQPVSLSRGLKFACSRWKSILMWALLAGLVGLIIKAIERRFQLVGQITARVIGAAWSIAAVFVIPVIVREEHSINPFSMLKKSAGILKNAWGEGLIGYVGMGAINFIFIISSTVVLAGTATLAARLHNTWLLPIIIGWWVVVLVLWSYLMNVAGLVYKGALYLYAAEGVTAEPFNQDLLNSAWKFKKNRTTSFGL